MNRSFIYVLSQNKIANVVFIISSLTVFLLDIVYANEKELFSGGAELAKLTTNIAMSVMAGYIFYVISAVKLDADRIERSKKASTTVVNRILNINSHLFSQLSDSPQNQFSPTPDENQIAELLRERKFSDEHRNKIYTNSSGDRYYKTLHYFLFEDCIFTNKKAKQDLEMYFLLLEPDLQIAFCDYFNCKFNSIFFRSSSKDHI